MNLTGEDGIPVLKVSLRNLGNVSASSVRAELRGSNVFAGTMSDYLASVDSNRTVEATFALDVVDQARPDVYTLSLRVSQTQDGLQFSQTLTITVRVEASLPVALYASVIVGVVAVACVLAYLVRRLRARSL